MSNTVYPATNPSPFVLHDVDWATYVKIRAAKGNSRIRMTYDQGVLVLMSPSRLHERIAELLGRMVHVWTEHQGIACSSAGSTTIKRPMLDRGLEPDKCFYIQHEATMRNRDTYDADQDPPPDLAIEVDVTSPSINRMPIYAAIGVPELWRWQDDTLTMYRLSGETYDESNASSALPGFPIRLAMEALEHRSEKDETSLVRDFRRSIQS